MKYQLTDEADRDVEGILEYSVINFGTDQAQHYFEALKECIELLAENPRIGHSTQEILPDYLRFPFESHVIFYKIFSPLTIRNLRTTLQKNKVIQ